jgi:hypothetical protein
MLIASTWDKYPLTQQTCTKIWAYIWLPQKTISYKRILKNTEERWLQNCKRSLHHFATPPTGPRFYVNKII